MQVRFGGSSPVKGKGTEMRRGSGVRQLRGIGRWWCGMKDKPGFGVWEGKMNSWTKSSLQKGKAPRAKASSCCCMAANRPWAAARVAWLKGHAAGPGLSAAAIMLLSFDL